MLRAVRLNNFVKFREDCNLSFRDGGAYFFVGQNGSGKSSVLEAIRRCLSQDSNTSFSRMPDESKPTYIICEYEIPDEYLSLFDDCKNVFTSFLHIPHADSNYKYAKIFLLVKKKKVFIELIERKNASHVMTHCTCSFQDDKEEKIRSHILKYLPLCTSESNSSEKSKISLLKYLQELLELKKGYTRTGETVDETLKAEAFLKTLENSIVFTFGLRSLGPLQWSKSKRIKTSERINNYMSAREKCEVINYFLSKENKDKYDSKKEDEIFRMLTDQANYSFDLQEDGFVAVKLDGEGVEVLKLSEGILEAKYLSLLLASKAFVTVLLEEPDRGMHPQMIQIIRDIVLPQVKDKTIIIVSHNPLFISSWSIPKTFKFYKVRDKGKWISRMVPVGRVAQNGKKKIPRLLASEEYVSMIFAKNVIFVEGQSDFYFVKAIVAHMLNRSNDKSTKKVLNLALSEEKTNTQQPSSSDMGIATRSNEYSEDKLPLILTFLASLHVVKMSGEKIKNKWKKVSKELGLSCLFLLDRDAVVKVEIVDTCSLAAELVKSDIDKLVTEAFKPKQGKREVKSQNAQQIPKSQTTQENPDFRTEAMTIDCQQPLPEVVEPEQGKQKTNADKDRQGNLDLAKLKAAVTEAMINNFCNQKNTANEETKDLKKELESAKEKMKEVIEKIVSHSDSWNDVEKILNKDDKLNYLQYFRFMYEDLLDNTSDKIPTSTILREPKVENDFVSKSLEEDFVKFVKQNKWEEARKCLEKEGVFVWSSGNLEDAFIDLVINFDCTDVHTKHAEMLRRHMSFARLGIDLNLTRLSTKKQTKLFMDDKVSDENISKSVDCAFSLCEKKSDITQFIRFLVRGLWD